MPLHLLLLLVMSVLTKYGVEGYDLQQDTTVVYCHMHYRIKCLPRSLAFQSKLGRLYCHPLMGHSEL